MLFTIFGATGDLTAKKLVPALYALYMDEQLPKRFAVVCIGRRAYNDGVFLEEVREKLSGVYDKWEDFKTHISYYQMDFSNPEAYGDFEAFVRAQPQNESGDKIYYLATAPRFFPIIAKALIEHRLLTRGDMREKIVFEKPFGEDLESAVSYNRLLLESIEESQVYRIDHYLGKEMLQNIMMIRFTNKIFESIWNHENIEHVKIVAYESETVKQRGGYYDSAGALKDMMQNHLFQTLALVAMDPPYGLSDELIKNQKVKVLEHLRVESPIIFGQYDGYLDEKGIPPTSKTETFVAMKAFVDRPRWLGTPFYLVTGKKMDEKRAEIVITFKDSNCLFEKGQPDKNKLTIEIFPREGIILQFNGKAPGLVSYAMPMKMDYCHMCNVMGNSPEAYEKLILDVIHDDASLFTRWDEIENAWRVIDRISKGKQNEPLHIYKNQSEIEAVVRDYWGDKII
ncbi:MAG: glucose-6-phosphate 1-dehydrogenase [Clostridiales bacterium]|jgi:glucose-6-phosphate 1-dehydrogenase|nr:glucose-6-phosphate 1-dehydrogenase [Clostridiales bacterium]